MIVIDMLGQICPVPVIKTKQAIEAFPPTGGVVKVLVDNAVACENLEKMSSHKGYKCKVDKLGERNYAVVITVGAGHQNEKDETPTATSVKTGSGLVIAIGRDSMGHGSEELGKILIKGFIFSISQLSIPPKAILFFNSGVKLTTESSNALADLKVAEEKGTKIRVCGTCVDYFGCKAEIAVGEIVNMYDIVEFMSDASSVINI